MVKGRSLQEVAEEMTAKFPDLLEREKQVRTIRKDWNNRGKWMDNVVRLKDGTFLTELVAGMDEAMSRCWLEAKSKNPSVRVGALRTIIMGKTRVGLLLMKAGVIQQAPQQIESTMTIAGTPFDIDPQLKAALLVESEKQRLEKEAHVTSKQPSSPGQE
jgi:hypothetical protein